jgi:DNA-directed RNA polymerase subunit RPC12/RpoP
MVDHINYAALLDLVGDRLGMHDLACPSCGPSRRSAKNRTRAVLRVWQEVPGFITYSCARCGARGYTRASGAEKTACPAPAVKRPEWQPKSDAAAIARRDKARWLWSQRQPIRGTLAEIYLREARHYGGPLPGSLGFLPKRAEHPPAMIAAFGLAEEIEPGFISVPAAAVAGVHLTRLAPDGRAKAGTETDKIMIGAPLGSPIVLAAPNELNGLAITEGIEDALSVYEATGLGAWAAGAASFLPALAAAVPEWIECITILVDDDDAGRRNADALAERLEHRGFPVRLLTPTETIGRC